MENPAINMDTVLKVNVSAKMAILEPNAASKPVLMHVTITESAIKELVNVIKTIMDQTVV